MPIPTVITDLSTTASSNYPDGDSESPIVLDDVQRAHAAFIAQLRDDPTANIAAPVPVADGGTGSATAANARTALGAAVSGANNDITSLTALTAGGLPNNSVLTADIADANITTIKILDSNVTTAKIADANVTAAKLSGAQTGSAPVYGIRAWINFNGTGTAAVKGSGNATLTDNGTGDYTVTFTTAMPDANYSVTFGLGSDATSSGCAVNVMSQLAGSIRFEVFRWNGSTIGTKTDLENISVTIVR